MLISFTSAKSSPGVTTAVLAVASRWPRPAIAMDLDPQGGDILAGVGGGRFPAAHGIIDLVVESRRTGIVEALRHQVTRPAAHSPLVLAGFGAPGQAASISWEPLARQLTDVPGADILADCGRYTVSHPAVAALRRSHLTVVVTGSSLRAVRATARTVPLIRAELGPPDTASTITERIALVVVGPGRPYEVAEIARVCGADVVGSLPHDPRTAEVWTDGAQPGRGFRRSPLQREAFDLALDLLDLATGAHPTTTAAATGAVRHNGQVSS